MAHILYMTFSNSIQTFNALVRFFSNKRFNGGPVGNNSPLDQKTPLIVPMTYFTNEYRHHSASYNSIPITCMPYDSRFGWSI